MRIKVPAIHPRPYQVSVFEYWQERTTPGRAVEVWARRGGKDLTYMSVALMLSYERKGLYLHFLPEFAHARRSLWDAFDNEGNRLIETAIPLPLRKVTHEQDMRIELHNGSVWQLGGSDQYNRWVGGNPIWCCYSEYALANPRGWDAMRPVLKINGGHAAFIGTPRGYNHLHTQLELAKSEPSWRHSLLTAIDMGVMTMADIDEEKRLGMPEEWARQEYLCDFSAANLGAILGKYVEAAEREGRLTTDVWDSQGAPVIVSSDIGFRDTAAFWFWQPRPGGFALVDYDEDTGLDADDWIERLRLLPWNISTLYLPHDARAKTFQSKHSVVEKFLSAELAETVKLTPPLNAQDKVNAARSVMPRCWFNHAACAQGLLALREWSFKWDDERRNYSREPDHNWASHAADAFAYGATVVNALSRTKPKPADPMRQNVAAAANFTLNQLFRDHERDTRRSRLE